MGPLSLQKPITAFRAIYRPWRIRDTSYYSLFNLHFLKSFFRYGSLHLDPAGLDLPAVVTDLYSRRVVGWLMDRRMKKALVIRSLIDGG
jgi:transposase InsO family protein